jgi:outer membrane receptor protein involved in Fe transport
VAHAELTVLGTRTRMRTDAEGRFTWPPALRAPLDAIVILADGRVSRPIRVAAIDESVETELIVETARSESVIVHGTAPDIDAAAGASRAFIAAGDLERRRPATFVESLENVTGVSVISEGQGATPAIRGLARGRTLILVDGARAMSERGAGPNAAFLDPATLRSVEVARGPGSVAYGSDAFGGIIAARTRRPDFTAPLRFRAAVTGGAGSIGTRVDAEVSSGYGSGGVLFGARQRMFDDYSAPSGEVPHSAWQDAGMWGRWAHASDDALWTAGWQSDRARDVHRPRSDSSSMVATSPFEESHRATLSYERREWVGFRDVRMDALFGSSRQRQEQDRLAAPGRPRRIDRADLSARDYQVRLTGRRHFGSVRFHGGLDTYGRFGFESIDTVVPYNGAGAQLPTQTTLAIEDAHRMTVGAFIDGDVALNRRVEISGGLRGDAIEAANHGGFAGDRSVDHHPLAGALAITVRPVDDLALTAQVARGFRDPTLIDRYYRGPVGRGFVEGNPDLKPETSLQFDVTGLYELGRIQIAGAVYDYRLTDLVERYSAGTDLFRLRNRARARLTGGEVDVRWDVGRGLVAEFGVQASRGRDRDNDAPLDDVPPAAVRLVLSHQLSPRLSSYFRLAAVGAHDRSGPGEVPTPGYTLLDVAVEWRLSRLVAVRGLLRNGLNESYYSSASPRWVWAPGRQAAITLAVSR